MITFSVSGSFTRTDNFLKKMSDGSIYKVLSKYGEVGVQALSSATPASTGRAAQSWSYIVTRNAQGWELSWTNSDIENGFKVAIGIQYGYGTGTGGYVAGRDYINPAIRPVFDQIAQAVWNEVTRA